MSAPSPSRPGVAGRDPMSLAGALDCCGLPLCSFDAHMRLTGFNAAYAGLMREQFGAAVEVGGALPDYLASPESAAGARADLQRALAGEQVVAEFSGGEDAEDRRRLSAVHDPVRDDTGAVTGVVVRIEDVTERRRAETDLLAELDLARALNSCAALDAALQAVLGAVVQIDEVDCAGIYLVDPETGDLDLRAHVGLPQPFVDSAAHYPADSPNAGLVLSGAPIYRSHRDLASLTNADAVRRHEGLRAVAVVPVAFEDRVLAVLNAASHTCDDFALDTRVVLETFAQSIGGGLARARAESALGESEKRLRTVFATMAEGVVVISPDGRIVQANEAAEAILGLERREIEERSYTDPRWDILRPDGSPMPPEEMAGPRAMAELREVRGVVMGIVRPSGATRWASVSAAPVLDDAGALVAVVGTFVDITDRKRAEDEIRALNTDLERRVRERTARLEQTTRELESFVYSVSHDLRSPLRAVDGFSLSVLEDSRSRLSDQSHRDLVRVRAAAQRMGALTDALLSLARLGRSEGAHVKVDVSALVRSTMERLAEAEPQRTVTVVVPDGLTVETDPGLLTVVLENLLGNAWKFTAHEEKARIEMTGDLIDGRRVFSVRDNGAGFDGAYADTLFRPFHRLHVDSEFPGTGIGLATVKHAVERLGGECWAEGAPNEGACVYFTLGAPAPRD